VTAGLVAQEPPDGVDLVRGGRVLAPVANRRTRDLRHARRDDPERLPGGVVVSGGDLDARTMKESTSSEDCWAAWLRRRRSGGDVELERRMLERLGRVRDEILDRAAVTADDALLDVGCGNGLVGFGALERGARVVFSDVSRDLLDECRATAAEAGALDRCTFVLASADDLSAIEDASVDVVTTRSVLIYVEDKRGAFAEFFRVLRPGGRSGIWEPINRFGMDTRVEKTFWGYELAPIADLAPRIGAVYEAIQPPSDPMIDFDERDLVALALQAGFFPIELALSAEIAAAEPQTWSSFLHSSGNPRIPTLAEATAQVLTAEESRRFEEHLRPLVEKGLGTSWMAKAHLKAVKPGWSRAPAGMHRF